MQKIMQNLNNPEIPDKTSRIDKELSCRDCSIATVISNKGGAGKTSVAIALSLSIAKSLKEPVLLLELDSSPGDFGSIFDIGNENSLEMGLKFPEKISTYVKEFDKNFYVLKGISNPLIAEQISSGSFMNLIGLLRKYYKYIVIDTQTVINGIIMDSLRVSEKIFLINECSLESTARTASLRHILVNKFLIPDNKINLVINKKKVFDFFNIWHLVKIFDKPIIAVIGFDRSFDKRLIYDEKRLLKSRFYRSVEALTQYL